jgi:hypothetical protein
MARPAARAAAANEDLLAAHLGSPERSGAEYRGESKAGRLRAREGERFALGAVLFEREPAWLILGGERGASSTGRDASP